jgi:lysophospholipase L1-like esterase
MKNTLFYLLLIFSQIITAQEKTDFKFSFGPNAVPGYIKVDPTDKYSDEPGYGFDFGTSPVSIDRTGKNNLSGGLATSDKPFFFSVKIPEGNYDVRIMTGDPDGSSETTIRIESRRLFFEKIATPEGLFRTLEATVNIRVPEIAGTNEKVNKKPRELYKLDWDDKMTFEFNGEKPCIRALEITKNDKAVTIYLAGNSTVVDQDDDPWASWGQMFPRFLKQGIVVANHAESGLSLGSFISGNRLKKVLSTMKPGDYLFIEFGHNDMKEKGPDDGAYKSYSERMRLFVTETRKKGGIPVIVSPANRRSFGDEGKITNSLGDYPAAAKKIADELKVPFIDLNAMTKIMYEAMGPEKSKNAFVIYPANSFPGEPNALNDNTHFNSYGAYQLAKCIIEGIRENKLGITEYLVSGLPKYDPAKPDSFDTFYLPLSPHSPVIIVPSTQLANTQLSWPEITRENKPWTRWWWPGSIVNEKDLTNALEKYSKAGLGGLELTVLYGVKGQEEKFINYLSPEWMKMFVYTLNEAKKLDLGVDLANSSSWPFGGPWVTNDDASKYVTYKTWSLKEGESLKEPVIFIQEPSIKLNGTARPEISSLTDPVYLNKDLQTLAIDQIRFPKPIPLQALMAYSDAGQIVDLTDKVDSAGILKWTAAAGTWTLYGVFQGWHGKMVERAGPGGEGYVIDHFSGSAITGYLKYFDNAFKGFDLSYLRGYFNDSYEVDDARGQSCWTPEMFNEFRIRRGYDLRQNLPALFQKDTPEKNAGVLSDYRQTVSDLILDKFTVGWTDWAHKQGKITRNQAHGSPGNILDLYAASDIPETEGTEILRMKFGTSAANVSGKKFASAEAATWLGEHFSSTLGDVKKAVDQFFIAGVNNIFYHGTCYSPANDPWPGFQFYAAVEFSPANSFWNDFPILNNYVARVQSFTQSSKPDNDILLYFPIFDRFSDYNNVMLEHFDAISPRFNETPFKTGAQTMKDKGYSFDYISDLQISNTVTNDGLIMTGGRTYYKTIVLPGCKYIPVTTFEKIINLAEKGAIIIVLGSLPENVSGWKDLSSNQEKFAKIKEKLNFKVTADADIRQAAVGKGKVFLGNDINKLLSVAGIRREIMIDNGLTFSRRSAKTGSSYFIINQSDKSFNGWITLQVRDKSAAIFNPMTVISGIAETRISSSGNLEVKATLLPYESIIVETSASATGGEKLIYYEDLSAPKEIQGTWKIDFITGGPELPSSKELTKLVSWTETGGEAVKDFSGTAIYTIKFDKPSENADAWQLNLGKVCESARILLNGNEIATMICPDYQAVIPNSLLKSKNILEIKVSNLSANRIAYLDRNNVPWKKFYNTNFPSRLPQNRKNGLFDASAWLPRESGLIGPVTIMAMKKK